MRALLRKVFAIPLFLVALTAAAPAQQEPRDPFAARHSDLLRAAEFHLMQAGKSLPGNAPQLTPAIASAPSNTGREVLASISPVRLAAAREKLLALGVDAARMFAEEGVPDKLLVIAEVESSFNPRAVSPKGARGLWQFMPDTARRYGLRVDERVDERTHVARSTRAAARYLRDLYLLFGNWQLALAGYNAGESRVAAAIDRGGHHSLTGIFAFLPPETFVYVHRVLGESPGEENSAGPV